MAEAFPEVAGFLASLDHDQRERFMADCEGREPPYQLWLYACALGYEGSFEQLEAWLDDRFPQLNCRRVLLAEAVKLEKDIQLARLESPDMKPGEGARTIATLSKELRGHLTEVDRMGRSIDRRGLVMAGADRLLRELEAMFDGNDEVQKSLSEAFEVVWGQVKEER
jgi:hypothetical protein